MMVASRVRSAAFGELNMESEDRRRSFERRPMASQYQLPQWSPRTNTRFIVLPPPLPEYYRRVRQWHILLKIKRTTDHSLATAYFLTYE
jgi:hypothetical protein